MVISHSGVTEDVEGAQKATPPFDNCSYLEDRHIGKEQNVSDPEKKENTVALFCVESCLVLLWFA